jgi:hypothetical protein
MSINHCKTKKNLHTSQDPQETVGDGKAEEERRQEKGEATAGMIATRREPGSEGEGPRVWRGNELASSEFAEEVEARRARWETRLGARVSFLG